MNRLRDIDDGLDEFSADRTRYADEAYLKQHPKAFQIGGSLGAWHPAVIDSVVLLGDKRETRFEENPHPLQYESGYLHVRYSADSAPMEIRWVNYGESSEDDAADEFYIAQREV